MTIYKFLYIILVIVAILFFILYSQPFSFYFLIFVAALPIFMAISTIIAKLFVKCQIKSVSDSSIKKSKAEFVIEIKNSSLLPLPNVTATIEYYNSLLNIHDHMFIEIPIHPLTTERIKFSLTSEYCGILNVKIKSIKIYDYIKLFSCRIKSNNSCQIVVFPEILTVNSSGIYNMINADDGDVFSKHKSGDDPSEIFALKDYIAGDKPNRIHWNLSLKNDNLIVKHYSQPLNSSILVIFDLNNESTGKTADRISEDFCSVACFFIENEVTFNISYYNKNEKNSVTDQILNEADISDAMKDIFKTAGEYEAKNPKMEETIYNFSNIIYISSCLNNVKLVSEKNVFNNIRIIYVNDKFNNNDWIERNDVSVINAGNENSSINI